MKGRSTKFAIDKSFGDDLRKVQGGKTQLKKKRADVLYKIEAVEQDLKDQYFNMEAQIAGFGEIGGNDRSAMYLNMVNGGLQSLETYYKYKNILLHLRHLLLHQLLIFQQLLHHILQLMLQVEYLNYETIRTSSKSS